MTQKPEITFEVEETIVLKQGGKMAASSVRDAPRSSKCLP